MLYTTEWYEFVDLFGMLIGHYAATTYHTHQPNTMVVHCSWSRRAVAKSSFIQLDSNSEYDFIFIISSIVN